MKPVLIKGGGDWTDASANVLDVPDDLDIGQAYQEYKKWFRSWDRRTDFLNFGDWLKKNRGAVDSKIEEIWDGV